MDDKSRFRLQDELGYIEGYASSAIDASLNKDITQVKKLVEDIQAMSCSILRDHDFTVVTNEEDRSIPSQTKSHHG